MVYGDRFNYPRLDQNRCNGCGKCVRVCPSDFLLRGSEPGFKEPPFDPTHECHLVHSTDPRIRHDGASGGVVTGAIWHLMDRGLADGGIVARCQGEDALVARSFVARNLQDLLSAQGSKYAPVSSCASLREVLGDGRRYVMVGTPCMLEGTAKLEEAFPALRSQLVLKIGFVCAGMASRQSTRNYIEGDGHVDLRDVRRILYRGHGWPGRFRVFGEGGQVLMDRPLIGGSLEHVVGKDHYLRCWNCMDHWSRFADIVVSDPWTEEMVKHETIGWTAVMARTERGRAVIASALAEGHISGRRIGLAEMLGYNKHLLIESGHERESWMAWYQLLFFQRLRYLRVLIQALLKGQVRGFRTTWKARRCQEYYY